LTIIAGYHGYYAYQIDVNLFSEKQPINYFSATSWMDSCKKRTCNIGLKMGL